MLNIKTLIQSVYSYIISKIKKSYRTFIALSAAAVAGVLLVSITTMGNASASLEDDEEFSEICADELETGIMSNDTNGRWETEKDYCLSLENNYTFVLSDDEEKTETSENALTVVKPLAGSTFEMIQSEAEDEALQTQNNEQSDTVSDSDDEMSDNEVSAILEPGDLFEGSDGTILVANKLGITITQEDYNCLLKIIQAEAGDQGLKGKILVGNVIINRVKSSKYANDIQGVVFQKGQFTPTNKGGSYYRVTPDKETVKAVKQVLSGVDYSQKALYFCCKTSKNSMFNTKLTFLFKYKDHYFYKPKK